MAEHEQAIHLYVGDQAMQGYNVDTDAGAYDVDDTVRPINRYLDSGSQDEKWILPAPCISDEWGLEHVLPVQYDPITLNFLAGIVPAKLKVCIDDATPAELLPAQLLRDPIDAAMERAAIEPLFALSGDVSFTINGASSYAAGSASTSVPAVVRPSGWELRGTHIGVVTTFASGDARDDDLISFPAAASACAVRIALSGGASRLEVDVAGTTYNSPTFTHAAGALQVVIDFTRNTAFVYNATGELARVTIAGNWSPAVGLPAQLGQFDGTISAPRDLPRYAKPRLDAIFFAMWNEALLTSAPSPVTTAEELARAFELIRAEPWGAHAQIVLLMPPETLNAVNARWLRETLDRVAARLAHCTLIDTRALAFTSATGCEVLTGASVLALADLLQFDFENVANKRRYARRRRGVGYRRFATKPAASAFCLELAEVAPLREVSPALGGPGQQAELGYPMPWTQVRTQRGPLDYVTHPATGEYLVPIDRLAVLAGYDAPSGDFTRIAGDERNFQFDYAGAIVKP